MLARIGAVAALSALTAAAGASTIPVDVRPPAVFPAPAGPPPSRLSNELPYEVLAASYVQDEMNSLASRLARESGDALADVDEMWQAWRSGIGVRGGFLDQGLYGYYGEESAGERRRAEGLQGELFRLETRAKQLTADARAIQQGLRAAGGHWDALLDCVDSPCSATPRLRDGLAALRGELARLAAKLNALDVDVRDRQEDLDALRPRIQHILQDRLASPPALSLPSHWGNALRDEPRALARFELEEAFARARERAMREMIAPAERPAPSGPAPEKRLRPLPPPSTLPIRTQLRRPPSPGSPPRDPS
ncbi:MAG TPA: hypothetical protein VNI01_05840 [Elusimicrobiota bacterium]|nr:hypothetical protein [Elusimicrobiota bacterium]